MRSRSTNSCGQRLPFPRASEFAGVRERKGTHIMNPRRLAIAAIVVVFIASLQTFAEVKVTSERNDNEHATGDFKFKNVPAPAKDDAGTKAKISIVDGVKDDNSGDTAKLNDGKLPTEQD